MPLTPEGWTLLKAWEGCRLSAYPDPASGAAPWTIGYGHTGPVVAPGLTITQQQADALLQKDVADAANAMRCADQLLLQRGGWRPGNLNPAQAIARG
jgi:lysozyme